MRRLARDLLLGLAREIDDARAEAALLREALATGRAERDDRSLRLLIAETPQAEHEAHLAAERVNGLERRLAEVEATLAALTAQAGHLREAFLERSGA
ncbi:MAG TPA: hypothetical protein VHL78_08775 [Actinomycetota bacterium]|nr:hypothetical protein [Actinomycetota bacterium]